MYVITSINSIFIGDTKTCWNAIGLAKYSKRGYL